MQDREFKIFILFNALVLFFTLPGAITAANFDSWGFLCEISFWLDGFIGLTPLIVLYLIIKKEKKLLLFYLPFLFILCLFAWQIGDYAFKEFGGIKHSFLDHFACYPAVAILWLLLSLEIYLHPKDAIQFCRTFPYGL